MNEGQKKLIMSIPSEVEKLNAKCANATFFFYLRSHKKCKCGKLKEGLCAGNPTYTAIKRLWMHDFEQN